MVGVAADAHGSLCPLLSIPISHTPPFSHARMVAGTVRLPRCPPAAGQPAFCSQMMAAKFLLSELAPEREHATGLPPRSGLLFPLGLPHTQGTTCSVIAGGLLWAHRPHGHPALTGPRTLTPTLPASSSGRATPPPRLLEASSLWSLERARWQEKMWQLHSRSSCACSQLLGHKSLNSDSVFFT